MKKVKVTVSVLCMAMIFASCGSLSNTAKGGIIGGTSGTALGAVVGGLIGNGKGAAIGAAVGAAVGTSAGVIIGKKMDKKAQQAAQIEGASVETVEDSNGLEAVKVTFDSGILFALNSSTLSSSAQKSLKEFAEILKEDNTLDIAIIGHTDKTGTYEVNQKVSTQRAQAVETYLKNCGVGSAQIKNVQGVAYDQYDDTKTAAENRRVEVYMYASEEMIKNAEAGV
jgi:outer membrane protein OmpA-like peptidoglycan-associated protein